MFKFENYIHYIKYFPIQCYNLRDLPTNKACGLCGCVVFALNSKRNPETRSSKSNMLQVKCSSGSFGFSNRDSSSAAWGSVKIFHQLIRQVLSGDCNFLPCDAGQNYKTSYGGF